MSYRLHILAFDDSVFFKRYPAKKVDMKYGNYKSGQVGRVVKASGLRSDDVFASRGFESCTWHIFLLFFGIIASLVTFVLSVCCVICRLTLTGWQNISNLCMQVAERALDRPLLRARARASACTRLLRALLVFC